MNSNKIFDTIFQCTFGMIMALAVPTVFLLVINSGLLNAFSIENKTIIFISYLAVFFYLAWMSGAFASDFEGKLSSTLKGLLSSVYVNCFSVFYFYEFFIIEQRFLLMIIIVLGNCLFSLYGYQVSEKFIKKQKESGNPDHGIIFQVALCVPVPFFAIVWLLIFGYVKFFAFSFL